MGCVWQQMHLLRPHGTVERQCVQQQEFGGRSWLRSVGGMGDHGTHYEPAAGERAILRRFGRFTSGAMSAIVRQECSVARYARARPLDNRAKIETIAVTGTESKRGLRAGV